MRKASSDVLDLVVPPQVKAAKLVNDYTLLLTSTAAGYNCGYVKGLFDAQQISRGAEVMNQACEKFHEDVTLESAKNQIKSFFEAHHGEDIGYAELREALCIPLPVIVDACDELEKEGKIAGVDYPKSTHNQSRLEKSRAGWTEKLFEAKIPARTLEQQARRIEQKNATNVASVPTPEEHKEIPENKVGPAFLLGKIFAHHFAQTAPETLILPNISQHKKEPNSLDCRAFRLWAWFPEICLFRIRSPLLYPAELQARAYWV